MDLTPPSNWPCWLRRGLLLLLGAGVGMQAPAAEPGPTVTEFPVATVAALLRPVETQRVVATASGRFHLLAAAGLVTAGAKVGQFDDAELRAALDTAQLRLRAARQQEADFAADAPVRRQEAQARLAELESRLALAEAVAKNPALLRELPPAVQAPLLHVDPAGLRALLDAARAQLARLDAPAAMETSAARLQVVDAERAVRDAERQLRDAVVVAPLTGMFSPAPALAPGGTLVGAGQEIGTVRDLTRLVAAVPALSPYLVRVDLARTALHLTGPGGRRFSAGFRGAVTEPTPVMGETRLLLYEFSPADSAELGGMVQTNVDASIVLTPAAPVAVVDKLRAALDHPGVFREGWMAGVAQAWPGWRLECEGETALGLVRSP